MFLSLERYKEITEWTLIGLKAPTYNQLSKGKIFINEKLEAPKELP